MGLFVVSLLATIALFYIAKEDFIPSVDTGQIQVATEAQDRVSFDSMVKYAAPAGDHRPERPQCAGGGVVGGFGRRPAQQRHQHRQYAAEAEDRPAAQAVGATRSSRNCGRSCRALPGVNAYMQNPPSIRVGGQPSKSTYQYVLQDTNQQELDSTAVKLMGALSHAPGFADVTTDMDLTAPAANVDIDRDQAAAQGVSVQSIETALGASFGGEQISTLYASDAEYWVMLELLPQYQIDVLHQSALCVVQPAQRLLSRGSAPNSGSGTASATASTSAVTPPLCR